jgi:hypothetical protein
VLKGSRKRLSTLTHAAEHTNSERLITSVSAGPNGTSPSLMLSKVISIEAKLPPSVKGQPRNSFLRTLSHVRIHKPSTLPLRSAPATVKTSTQDSATDWMEVGSQVSRASGVCG